MRKRQGAVLVPAVFFMLLLLTIFGIVIDTGLLLTSRRVAQNAADCAALAGAQQLILGGDVVADAQTYASLNASGCQVLVDNPPTSGQYTGDANYVRVVVTLPCPTTFFGQRDVAATATAGVENGQVFLVE
jgi:uncharacterized membrane protein